MKNTRRNPLLMVVPNPETPAQRARRERYPHSKHAGDNYA